MATYGGLRAATPRTIGGVGPRWTSVGRVAANKDKLIVDVSRFVGFYKTA